MLGFFCILFILIGCTSTPKVDTLKEAEIIRNLEDQWTAALLIKDIEKILSFSSSDGVYMDPNAPIYIGTEAIRKSNEKWFADTTILFDSYTYGLDTIEVSESGDFAYVRGHSHFNKKTPIGIVSTNNKFVDIWKRIDNQWKCILSIGNSDMPN